MEEDLKAKYGRRVSSQNESSEQYNTKFNDTPKDENEAKYGRNNTYTKKTKVNKVEATKERDIRNNIQDIISKYSQHQQDLSTPITGANSDTFYNTSSYKNNFQEETPIIKFLKAVVTCCIFAIVGCVIIAFIMRPQINAESEQIIEKIKKAEDLYYTKVNKYHYFSKTKYDHTLGIDLSKCKYFSSYEVVHDEENGNYSAKVYGATNAFTMAYYVIKTWIIN